MNLIVRRLLPAFLLWMAVFMNCAPAKAQDVKLPTVVSNRPAITVLDSTKDQDGLVGSVRRVKTETAKIELKDGRPVEGLPQLVELTTYGIKGNRVENTSYPIEVGPVGKEEYKYDEHGNITEMTVRDDHGAIVNREAYSYEFDKVGNWTKMVTSLVVFENGELKREPIEVTSRTITYYFDDTVAKIVEEPKVTNAPTVPEPSSSDIQAQDVLEVSVPSVLIASEVTAEPPPLLKSVSSVSSVAKPTTDDADAQLNLGHEFLKQGKDRDAIKAFKESIKLNPKNAETYYGLGFSNFRLGKFREAADAFKKATDLSPAMAKAHYGLSLAYQELGMTPQLMEQYRTLERLDKVLAKKLAQTFPQYNFSCRLTRGCP
jgi:Tfp pilus assembly protein PilF